MKPSELAGRQHRASPRGSSEAEQPEHPWSAGSCLGETPGDGAVLAFSKITPFSIWEEGTQAEREICSRHGKKITFLLTQMRSQSQLCPLEQRLLTSR